MLTIRFQAATTEEVREIARVLHLHREAIPSYNNTSSGAPWWAPVVHCEGPRFAVHTPVIPREVAALLLATVS